MIEHTLVFHHIPKTAGSTFYSILEKQYKENERFFINGENPADSLRLFRSFSVEQKKRIKLVYGHLADQLLSEVNKPLSILFLRDPVDHFISSFYYIKRSPFNRFHHEVRGMESIERFIELRRRENLDNLQTRHIAGDIGFILNPNLAPTESVYVDRLFSKAKERLQSTNFVFLTEYYDESLIILHKNLNWKSMPYYRVRNRTQNRPLPHSFSKETLLKIENLCQWDIQLYNLAKENFHRMFNPNELSFQMRVRNFRRSNRIIALLSI